MRQLRIYCAGVWHNFIIVLVAIGVLFTLPWLLWPCYSFGDGVAITSVIEVVHKSSLFAERHVYEYVDILSNVIIDFIACDGILWDCDHFV